MNLARDEEEAPAINEPRKRVTAILSAHLSGQLHDAVLAYAASLASDGQRVGVMTVDADEFKLQLVECDTDVPASEPEVSDLFDSRQMRDVVLELNHDVDRWLLVAGDHRRPETRSLIARADDWTMLATCDHDGIVSGYRTLKGLAESGKAPLAIALVDAPGEDQAERAYVKLASVCRQFLDWDVRHESLATDVEHAQAYTLLWCHGAKDKSIGSPQWKVVQDFLAMRPNEDADRAHYGNDDSEMQLESAQSVISDADDELDSPLAQIDPNTTAAVANQPLFVTNGDAARAPALHERTYTQPSPLTDSETAPMTMPTPMSFQSVSDGAPTSANASMSVGGVRATPNLTAGGMVEGLGEVIELPEGVSVLSAILKSGTELVATPIAPPMCPGATVAVGRDRGLVLVAQAGVGLAGLDAIAAAVRWLDDSKQLIAMAMPQMAIDSARPTRVELIIDHADRTAEGIRPLLGNSRITLRSYRRLRWAGRTGLLLDAA